MPAVKLSPLFNDQAITSTGAPASGYKVYSYTAGSSSALDTYTDSTGTVAQSNPVILNSNGFPTNGQIWLQAGLSYKLVLTDANDVVIKTEDNVTGINDTSSSVSQWQASGLTPTYVSATSFTLAGDQTAEFHPGRRVQCTVTAGTVYGTIASSVFSSSTTVVIRTDSGSLDSGLSTVNLSLIRADHSAITYQDGHGQCRLTKSGSNLLLSPYNGNKILIAGVMQQIPAAGVSLAPTSLSANTTYYIYAYMSAGVMMLEASTTSYVTGIDTDWYSGIPVKNNASDKTLVGMARTTAGTAWADTAAQRFVISYYNRKPINTESYFTAARSTVATSNAEINSEIRNEFLTWGEAAEFSYTGSVSVSAAGNRLSTSIAFNGTTAENVWAEIIPDGTGVYPICLNLKKSGLTEGYNYATLVGNVSTGTGTYRCASNAAGLRPVLAGIIQG